MTVLRRGQVVRLDEVPDGPLPGTQMPNGRTAQTVLMQPKLYLNGFPKAGLHWVELMAQVLTRPAAEPPWAGNLAGNSWLNDRMPDWHTYSRLSELQAGTYLMGHLAYEAEVADFLRKLGAAMTFIIRDPRDVAVSQSYHVASVDDDRLSHPDKAAFADLQADQGHEAVLTACIEGWGRYPGVMARWAEYAGWLDEPWVHVLRYEDMKHDAETAARRWLQYVFRRTGQANGVTATFAGIIQERVTAVLVEAMGQTNTHTYRKGTTRQWATEFTPEHKELFKQHDPDDWLIRLGYADDKDW